MKKLHLAAIAITLFIFSCKKENHNNLKQTYSENLVQSMVSSDDGIQDFVKSSWMVDYLSNHNYALGEVAEKYKQGNKVVYRFTLTNNSQRSNEVSDLIVYSYYDTKVLSPILVTKQENESYKTLKLISTLSDAEIAKAYISADNDSIWGVAPCPQQGLSFGDCMICSLNDITSDWVGWAACASCPSCCLIASGIACSLLLTDGNSDTSDLTNWINSNVGSDKYFKTYVTSGDKYIVN